MQVECGVSLAVLIEENLLLKENYDILYKFILESLETWNNAKWDTLYEHYIHHLDKIVDDEETRANILKKGVELSITLCELSQAIPSRWKGARIMAMLSNVIDRETAKKRLLSKMKTLWRDFNWEVRKAITGCIHYIFNLLTREEWDIHLFEIMVELLDDEEGEVKNLAIEAFLENVDRFTETKINESWFDIFVDLIKNQSNKELILEKLDTVIQNSESIRKMLCRKEYWEGDDEELKRKIIFNSPAFIAALGEKHFMDNIFDWYKSLLKDTNDETRQKCAKGIHEIVKIFGTISSYNNEFDKHISLLMLDKSALVLGTLLTDLHLVAEVLIPSEITGEMKECGLETKINSFKNTFLKNMIKMEEGIKQNWRYLNQWIDWVFQLIDILGQTNIIKKFVPIILTHLRKHGKETRKSCIMFMWRLIPINTNYSFRRDICDLSTSLPYATSSFTRLIYLEFLNEVIKFVSKRYFCMNFIDSYYLLSKDKCSNVLIKFWNITPNIFKKVNYEDSK